MNQVIIAYHVRARGEIRLSPELAEYKLFEPGDALCWPAQPGHRAPLHRMAEAAGCPTAGSPVTTRGKHMQVHKEIDTRGLNCPLPILKAKKALADMTSGQVLKVVATDPGSVRDFQAFARQTGNELIEQQSGEAEFVHFLRRR
jgi:TusA-related sulfurtransferase